MALAVNSGPPSVAHSSGMSKVANSRRKGVNLAFGSHMCSFNDWPVRVSVNHEEVVHPYVGEEICTDALKGVGRWDWCVGGGGALAVRDSIQVLLAGAYGVGASELDRVCSEDKLVGLRVIPWWPQMSSQVTA